MSGESAVILCLSSIKGPGQPACRAAEKLLFRPMADWVLRAVREAGAEDICIDSGCGLPAAYFSGRAEVCAPEEYINRVSGGVLLLADGAYPFLEAGSIRAAIALQRARGGVVVARGSAFAVFPPRALEGASISGIESAVAAAGFPVTECAVSDRELMTAHTKAELLKLNDAARGAVIENLLERGVEFTDLSGVSVCPLAKIAPRAVIHKGTVIKGECVIESGCEIGPDTVVDSSIIRAGAWVCQSVIEKSEVGPGVTIGPYSHLRPGCVIEEGCHIGNFVEIKNSVLGAGTKAGHLTYVGDTDCGRRVNFGCGTVTANYDGKKKHRTTIGDGAFIGSNTNLIAPVSIGEGAYTAAGSTITDDVPPGELAIARARQVNKVRKAAKDA